MTLDAENWPFQPSSLKDESGSSRLIKMLGEGKNGHGFRGLPGQITRFEFGGPSPLTS
jgi:hypothetical protein